VSARGRLTVIFTTALAVLATAYFIARQRLPADDSEVNGVPAVPAVTTSPAEQEAATDLSGDAIRSALEDLCDGDPPRDPWQAAAAMGPFDLWRQRLLDRLSASAEPEHLVFAALLDRESESRMNLVERAVATNPQDAFTLWVAVNVCADDHKPAACPRPEWERQLLSIDSQNSESWIIVAANRYRRGDLDAALDALQQAATSAESRAFWVETIEMAERGFAVAGDLAFPERATMAFGVAASSQPRINDYVKMCKEQSAADVNWAYACLAYGQTLEVQGKTEMGQSIALALQLMALEAIGDTEAFARVELRKQQRTQERMDAYAESGGRAEELMVYSPALFTSYLAAIRTRGEWEARRSIIEEIERLLHEQPELACKLERQDSRTESRSVRPRGSPTKPGFG
jgi:hypothetical protein